MPLNAKIFEADPIKLRVRAVLTDSGYSAPTGSHGNIVGFVEGKTRDTPDAIGYTDRIILRAETSQAANTWKYTYIGPGAPGPVGYVVSGAGFKTALDLEIRIRGVQPYVNGPGVVDSHKFRQIWSAVEVWIEGALNTTLPGSGVDENSVGLGPCFMPLLGIPLEVFGGWTCGEPTGVPEGVGSE